MPADSVAKFLTEEQEQGAAVLLACLAADSRESGLVQSAALKLLNVELESKDVARILARLPQSSADTARDALKQHGWGPHLRRLTTINPGEGG